MDKRTQRLLGFLALIAIVAVPLIALNRLGVTREDIRTFVEGLGVWAPVGLFLLRFTSVVIPALPGTAYSILAGSLLGFGKGLAVVCISDLLSCSLSFWLASRFGRSLVSRLVGDRFMGRVDSFSKKHLERNFFLMSAFMMTSFFDFVAYGVGLARTPWHKFLPALMLSIAISNPPIVALGAGIFSGGKIALILALLGVFGLALITGLLRRKTEPSA
ncbi:MAG: VTT domain-containing protein [Cyanobacteria bacterium J06623_5]